MEGKADEGERHEMRGWRERDRDWEGEEFKRGLGEMREQERRDKGKREYFLSKILCNLVREIKFQFFLKKKSVSALSPTTKKKN